MVRAALMPAREPYTRRCGCGRVAQGEESFSKVLVRRGGGHSHAATLVAGICDKLPS